MGDEDTTDTPVPDQCPEKCPELSTPWPITLADSTDLWERKQPDANFLKRMKIASTTQSALSKFIVITPSVQKTGTHLSQDAREAALQRRKDYCDDVEYCEPCNKRVIFNSREASCVCTRCGLSRNFQNTDTSYREGASMHSVYLYKVRT